MFRTEKAQQDRAYNEMLIPIIQKMTEKDIFEMASKSGGSVPETKDRIMLETFGTQVSVYIPTCEIDPVPESWHALVLLHYLVNADGMLPAGEWISFENMKDGLIRGTRFARSSAKWFETFLKGKQLCQVEKACLALGGEKSTGRGDINIRIYVFPNFPVLVSFWEADEDFDAAGKIFLDRSADHYLSIEDAVTVGEIIQKKLEQMTTG